MSIVNLIENPIEMGNMAEVIKEFYSVKIQKNEPKSEKYGKYQAVIAKHTITEFDPTKLLITGFVTEGDISIKFKKQCIEFFAYNYKLHSLTEDMALKEVERQNSLIYTKDNQHFYPSSFFLKDIQLQIQPGFDQTDKTEYSVDIIIGYLLSLADEAGILDEILPKSRIINVDLAPNNESIPLIIFHTANENLVYALDNQESKNCCYGQKIIGSPVEVIDFIKNNVAKSSLGFG